jgi:hypothetical protein
MQLARTRLPRYGWVLAAAFIVTIAAYWPGLHGTFLFDDYPNIVDNHGVQPQDASLPSLVRAALSSPSSEFKRPLASLSFAANYLATGLDPYGMKLTNLLIHLLNGWLVFLLARGLLLTTPAGAHSARDGFSISSKSSRTARASHTAEGSLLRTRCAPPGDRRLRAGLVATLIAAAWMLLPINLTGVLYVVQRMESMANLFVLFGLIGYVAGRRRMLATADTSLPSNGRAGWKGFWLCAASVTVPAAIGLMAKETTVVLPLYALSIEWALFGFRKPSHSVPIAYPSETSAIGRSDFSREDANDFSESIATEVAPMTEPSPLRTSVRRLPQSGTEDSKPRDWRITSLFLLVLVLPMAAGLAWLLPNLLNPATWASRNFTFGTRLLSEARIVTDYVSWTLLPTPDALSFYHDNFRISTGLLAPWTTLASIAFLAGLTILMLWLRPRRPLAALGIALFLGCQLLTGTILPLELIYEHRNYFASFGLLLTLVPLLAAPGPAPVSAHRGIPAFAGAASAAIDAIGTDTTDKSITAKAAPTEMARDALPFPLPRYVLLGGLLICWTALTALTAYAWGNPLRLAEDLASRVPQSPRAQYELGRAYIIYSHYDPASPFTPLVYAPLERAAALPGASILPEQALIFMNARMHLPLKDEWWDSLTAKLNAHPPGVQDESSLGALTQCAREQRCDLPADRMMQAFMAALSHPNPGARLLATYGDYAWNVLNDHNLGERMIVQAVETAPNEPAYRITLVRMLVVQGRMREAQEALRQLQKLNFAGRLDSQLTKLHTLSGTQ